MVVRRIFGVIKGREIYNAKVHNLYSSLNITRMIESGGYVQDM
jgi:hypothetical protein